MARAYLGEQDNELDLISEETADDRPVVRRSSDAFTWTGTANTVVHDDGEHTRGQVLVRSNRMAWIAKDQDGWTDQLRHGGHTTPEHDEERPFPCPHVRKGIETTYQDGAWWKRLNPGWTSADPGRNRPDHGRSAREACRDECINHGLGHTNPAHDRADGGEDEHPRHARACTPHVSPWLSHHPNRSQEMWRTTDAETWMGNQHLHWRDTSMAPRDQGQRHIRLSCACLWGSVNEH